MIDLEQPELPHVLVVGGEDVEVETSFRAWLRFGRILERWRIADPCVLKGECKGDWRPAALEFYGSENPTPKGRRSGGPRALDILADGDLIVGAFQQAYGIDLTRDDVHWHRFLALLRSLPEDTKLVKVMGYRTWRPDKRKHDAVMRDLRDEWALPVDGTEHAVRGEAEDFLDKNGARLGRRLGEVERDGEQQ